MLREICVNEITKVVARLCIDACHELPKDVLVGFHDAVKTEVSPLGKTVLLQLIENDSIARDKKISYCHDTGITVVYVEVGQDVHLVGGDFQEAIHEGVRQGYKQGFMRKSVVGDPLLRVNTDDNTPAIIHSEIVVGSEVKITVVPKGGGSENWSRLKFLLPGDGVEGVKQFILDTVLEAGGSACPPLTIGVGLGGSFDKVADLAKKAILREVGIYHEKSHIAQLEKDIVEMLNKTGIGPQGYGGKNTAIWAAVETYACHITALPVAINIQCHASRRKTEII